ncbi:histidine phosphatase family protein [Desulfosarcina ovata]|uniref:Phosphoglycerate mutase n=1 Tax=Desulfosarcina ovata subsp. ovata TaxID=2752305 RepID=A0A5K8ALL5_9BACT|nr:histidine phosphatase family protein [Desulfosarcina ovata]BBO93449.1 phosphoglycerate mutase [Desulfosarcina ovata subsp. ovata]
MHRDDASTTRFGLLRHVETVWNREKRIQGQQDSPLTANGTAMARQYGTRLAAYPWNQIVTSDLERAVQTGRLINETLKLPSTSVRSLKEMDWGEWTGFTLAQIRAAGPERLALLDVDFWNHGPPGGETRGQLFVRIREALLSMARCHRHERILVVVHGGVLKALFQGLADSPTGQVTQRPVSGYLHWLTSDGKTLFLGDAEWMGETR